MGYDIEMAMGDWLQSISRSEIDEYLSRLELRRQGSIFRLMDRLNKRMLGIYVPEDFAESASTDDAIARRTNRREELIRRIVTEQDCTFVETFSWDVHPLEVILKSEAILQTVLKTTREAAIDTQHPPTPQNADGGRNSDAQITEQSLSIDMENCTKEVNANGRSDGETTANGQEPQPEEMLRLLSTNGTEIQVPRDVGTLLAELILQVRSLQDRLTNQQRQAASSTRRDARPEQNVHFEDTFYAADEPEAWDERRRSCPPARPRDQAGFRDGNTAWEEGDRWRPARSTSWQHQTTQSTLANLSRSSLYHSRDVGEVVRKWQIRFSGAKSQSIEVFLARLEDCRVLANLTE